MDAEWCVEQEFGQRVAHGTMTFTIGVGLTASVINPVAFSLGYDRLRFIKPVHIGDTIHTEVEVVKKFPDEKRENYGRVVEGTSVINQDNKTVLFCEHIYLVQMKAGDGT